MNGTDLAYTRKSNVTLVSTVSSGDSDIPLAMCVLVQQYGLLRIQLLQLSGGKTKPVLFMVEALFNTEQDNTDILSDVKIKYMWSNLGEKC